jgi:hypothetical protein
MYWLGYWMFIRRQWRDNLVAVARRDEYAQARPIAPSVSDSTI